MKQPVVFFLIICSALADDPNDVSGYENNQVMLDDLYTLFWTVKGSFPSGSIDFALQVETTGWVGLGFSPNGDMIGSDVIIGIGNKDGTGSVQGYALRSKELSNITNSLNPSENLTQTSAAVTDHLTTVKFTRNFVTNSSFNQIINPNTTIFVIAAFGTTQALSYHGPNRVSLEIDFLSGSVVQEGFSTIKLMHATLMSIAWSFLFPLGAILARFFKGKNTDWFNSHRAVQITGMTLAITGFTLAIVMVQESDSPHFRSPHGIIGLTLMILALTQIAIAIFRPQHGEPRRHLWEFQHHWTARILIVLGWSNDFIGLVLVGADQGFVIVLACWIFMLFLYIFYMTSKGEPKNDGSEEPKLIPKRSYSELKE